MTSSETFHFGPFVLDAGRRRLERDGEEVLLQPKVFATLLYLVRRPRRVVSREELLATLWPDEFVTESVLTRCIKEVRSALGDDARAPRYVRTAQRVGYEMVAEVRRGAPAAEAPVTLAVLPFRPVVARDRDEALELGMADTLITRLSGLQRVVVRPLSAVRRYGGLDQDPLAAGREQGVEAVVEGTVRQAEGRLRVTVRVLRVSGATALLSETFDEPPADVFTMQDAISRRITDALALELTSREARGLSERPTSKPAAYRLYLLARLCAGRHTPEDDRRSIELLQQAVTADPDYARAWAELAAAWESLGTLETGAGHFASARRCATRALELDPDLVPALTCLGKVGWEHDWDWRAAEHHLRRALAAGPGNAEAHVAFSDFCAYQGRHEEAIAAAARALEIDPTSPWVGALLAQALYMAGLHDEAIAQAQRTLTAAPDFAFAHLFGGLAAAMKGRWDDAVAYLERARHLSGRVDFASAVGWALAGAGRREEARAVLRELEASEGTPPIALAMVQMGLGDQTRALDLLERAAAEGDWHVLMLHSEPMFRPLRAHPRAAGILARLALP